MLSLLEMHLVVCNCLDIAGNIIRLVIISMDCARKSIKISFLNLHLLAIMEEESFCIEKEEYRIEKIKE